MEVPEFDMRWADVEMETVIEHNGGVHFLEPNQGIGDVDAEHPISERSESIPFSRYPMAHDEESDGHRIRGAGKRTDIAE